MISNYSISHVYSINVLGPNLTSIGTGPSFLIIIINFGKLKFCITDTIGKETNQFKVSEFYFKGVFDMNTVVDLLLLDYRKCTDQETSHYYGFNNLPVQEIIKYFSTC